MIKKKAPLGGAFFGDLKLFYKVTPWHRRAVDVLDTLCCFCCDRKRVRACVRVRGRTHEK
jgi:hypothetical protein